MSSGVDYNFPVLVLGQSFVGKRSLVEKFLEDESCEVVENCFLNSSVRCKVDGKTVSACFVCSPIIKSTPCHRIKCYLCYGFCFAWLNRSWNRNVT